jgi:hypothetical protein
MVDFQGLADAVASRWDLSTATFHAAFVVAKEAHRFAPLPHFDTDANYPELNLITRLLRRNKQGAALARA